MTNKPLVFYEICILGYKSRISAVTPCLARVEADILSQEVSNISEQFKNYKFLFLKTYYTDSEHSQCHPLQWSA